MAWVWKAFVWVLKKLAKTIAGVIFKTASYLQAKSLAARSLSVLGFASAAALMRSQRWAGARTLAHLLSWTASGLAVGFIVGAFVPVARAVGAAAVIGAGAKALDDLTSIATEGFIPSF